MALSRDWGHSSGPTCRANRGSRFPVGRFPVDTVPNRPLSPAQMLLPTLVKLLLGFPPKKPGRYHPPSSNEQGRVVVQAGVHELLSPLENTHAVADRPGTTFHPLAELLLKCVRVCVCACVRVCVSVCPRVRVSACPRARSCTHTTHVRVHTQHRHSQEHNVTLSLHLTPKVCG